MFRASHGALGNAEFLFYRVEGACAIYLGSVRAIHSSIPRCVEPPMNGAVCRIAATRRMLHDDLQEDFYDLVDGTFQKSEHGRHIVPRQPRRKGK